MNDFYSENGHYEGSSTGDSHSVHDHSHSDLYPPSFEHHPHDYNLFGGEADGSLFGNDSVLQHHDPLSVAHHFNMPPLHVHFVNPHWVDEYTRADGTEVSGYFRDGDGSGYLRSNPDDTIANNLNELFKK